MGGPIDPNFEQIALDQASLNRQKMEQTGAPKGIPGINVSPTYSRKVAKKTKAVFAGIKKQTEAIYGSGSAMYSASKSEMHRMFEKAGVRIAGAYSSTEIMTATVFATLIKGGSELINSLARPGDTSVPVLYKEVCKGNLLGEKDLQMLNRMMSASKSGGLNLLATQYLLLIILADGANYEQPQAVAGSVLSHVCGHQDFAGNNGTFDPEKLQLRKVHTAVKEFRSSASGSWVKKSPESDDHKKWEKALADFILRYQLDASATTTKESVSSKEGVKLELKVKNEQQQKDDSMSLKRKAFEEPVPVAKQPKKQEGVFSPDSEKARQKISDTEFRKKVEESKGLQ